MFLVPEARHRPRATGAAVPAVGAAVPQAAATGAGLAAAAILAVEDREATGKRMNHELTAFVDDLKSTHGSNLASVILYGSAALGDLRGEKPDYNLLVALKKIRPMDLRNAHACVREWRRMGNKVPVYFTVSELQNAADVFPIEFQKMSAARKVLLGSDVLADLRISDTFLRHQTEYELRSNLIQLRRSYIPASASVEGIVALMVDSIPGFVALFRATLLVLGIQPPLRKREIVALTAQEININGVPFEKILNIRKGNFTEKLDEVSANQLFAEYMEQIEKVIDAVDAVGK